MKKLTTNFKCNLDIKRFRLEFRWSRLPAAGHETSDDAPFKIIKRFPKESASRGSHIIV